MGVSVSCWDGKQRFKKCSKQRGYIKSPEARKSMENVEVFQSWGLEAWRTVVVCRWHSGE
jgi:hypothetical protein